LYDLERSNSSFGFEGYNGRESPLVTGTYGFDYDEDEEEDENIEIDDDEDEEMMIRDHEEPSSPVSLGSSSVDVSVVRTNSMSEGPKSVPSTVSGPSSPDDVDDDHHPSTTAPSSQPQSSTGQTTQPQQQAPSSQSASVTPVTKNSCAPRDDVIREPAIPVLPAEADCKG
jgi:hypothetical protein